MNHDATVVTEFSIRDGAGGTVLWRTRLPALAVGGHIVVDLLCPLKSTANTLLEVICATTSSETFFNAQGFVAP